MTREQKIQDLRSDFLKRNGRNFTSRDERSRIGWEDTLMPGETYSSAITDIRNEEELHKYAYGHAKDMIVAMNIPFPVKLKIEGTGSYTDKKVVVIATDMLDDRRMTVGQKLDVFTGLAIHECCHLLYTEFEISTNDRLTHDIMNLIEDERIEMKLGQEKPGFTNFIGATKYHYFGKHNRNNTSQDDITRLFNAIIAMIRFPLAMPEDDIEKYADELMEVRDILQPYPQSTNECMLAAEKIKEILLRFQKEQKQQNKKQQNGAENKEKNNENSNQDQNSQSSSSEEKQELDKALSKVMESIERNFQSQSESHKKVPLPNERMSKFSMSEQGRRAKAIAGDIEIGKNPQVNIYFPSGNTDAYMESLARVKPYIPAMTAALRNNGADRVNDIRGLRNGRLDTNKLAEAVIGVETIYTRKEISSADRMAICILVDESGSMDGSKISAARDAAVLLNEAMKNIPNIDLFIYGHTTERNNLIKLKTYVEPGRKNNKHALGSIEAEWSNVDSLAILETAARVRARTRENCLFIVISDGAPCEPEQNVPKAVEKISKDGFVVVSVGIDFEYDPGLLYKNHVMMTDMKKLAPELGKMIKSSILKQTSRR